MKDNLVYFVIDESNSIKNDTYSMMTLLDNMISTYQEPMNEGNLKIGFCFLVMELLK